MNSEHHLGQAHRQTIVVDPDAISTCQRQLETATECEAFDECDRGAGKGLEIRKDAMSALDEGACLFHAAQRGEFLDVRTQHEPGGFTRENHHTAWRPFAKTCDSFAKFV